jgi:Transposase, Mutator family
VLLAPRPSCSPARWVRRCGTATSTATPILPRSAACSPVATASPSTCGFPHEHWNRIRHSNFIERTFGETRRRVKVIGCLPGEHSCLSLVWAVLDRASSGWRGFTMAPAGLRLLQDLRRQLTAPPAQLRSDGTSGEGEAMPENVTAVA